MKIYFYCLFAHNQHDFTMMWGKSMFVKMFLLQVLHAERMNETGRLIDLALLLAPLNLPVLVTLHIYMCVPRCTIDCTNITLNFYLNQMQVEKVKWHNAWQALARVRKRANFVAFCNLFFRPYVAIKEHKDVPV